MENDILLLDEEFFPVLTESECEDMKPIMKDFIEYYAENKERPVNEWLGKKMQEQLPEKTSEEIGVMVQEIITTIEINEANQKSLERATANGQSKESWFASEMKKATSAMSAQEASNYLQGLDSALNVANESLYRTIHTQAGAISQNPHLDGFIAEQYHAQTFNLNAEATGSPYRAKVLEPTGNGYAKNSVDIVIVDENGTVVRRYQSKYCKDAEATAKAFEQGDYRGQQKLVPEGQEQEIAKKTTTVIEAPDGTSSTPLSKERAKELQEEAQNGKWNELNWNEYKVKDLAIGIGKQAGQAALMGAAIGAGVKIAQKVWNGEKIKGEEVVESAVVSGADFGVKAAAAGALKVGAEKGIIKSIPKGTPAATVANIAHVAIENVKIIGKMAKGELTAREGLEKMEQTTVATIAGIAASAKGATIGAKIGTVFGPVGTVVGGFVGGTIGYMAGSGVAEKLVKEKQKLQKKAEKVVKEVVAEAKGRVSNAVNGVRNFCDALKHVIVF